MEVKFTIPDFLARFGSAWIGVLALVLALYVFFRYLDVGRELSSAMVLDEKRQIASFRNQASLDNLAFGLEQTKVELDALNYKAELQKANADNAIEAAEAAAEVLDQVQMITQDSYVSARRFQRETERNINRLRYEVDELQAIMASNSDLATSNSILISQLLAKRQEDSK